MKCLHSLNEALSDKPTPAGFQQSIDNKALKQLRTIDFNKSGEEADFFYDVSSNQDILQNRPWKSHPKFFEKVYISSLALMKMTIHANSGGSIEIMGMLTGKILKNIIVVMDVYSLPVEGTETRVNAQAEAYEYMVRYLENLKGKSRDENIVGWYHSHPGYGCWLSGIDVATQKLNQDFQDPYLAIVIDPIRTINQGKVEIGAFRTYPDNYKPIINKDTSHRPDEKLNTIKKLKQKDYGIHSERYYPLDIEIFKNKQDDYLISLINNESWINNLIQSPNYEENFQKELINNVLKLITQLQVHASSNNWGNVNIRDAIRYIHKFNTNFEDIITEKLLNEKRVSESKNRYKIDNFFHNSPLKYSNLILNSKQLPIDSELDNSDDSHSDFDDNDKDKGRVLDISDKEDAISVESSRSPSKYQNQGLDDVDVEIEDISMEEIAPLPSRKRMLNNSISSSIGDEADLPQALNPEDDTSEYARNKRLLQTNRKKAIKTYSKPKENAHQFSSNYEIPRADTGRTGIQVMKYIKSNRGYDSIDNEGKKIAKADLNNLLIARTQQRLFL